ncbi:MAG: hypothetical protein HFACDABA_00727 [Anaerolineales bacterium]|nr:hypothetical protein [Anaerolineales bacterium]
MKIQKGFLIFSFLLAMVLCFALLVVELLKRDDWKQATTPLSRESLVSLCKNLSLNDLHALCNDSEAVYAKDFVDVFEHIFLPKNGNPATYQNVEDKIGDYKVECKPVVHLPASGYSYFRCFYDLNGDGYWRYAFYFYYPDETLFSIRAGSPND